jgi:hypothetical protein
MARAYMNIRFSRVQDCLVRIPIPTDSIIGSDTWKYVLKYHVTLPKEFIDHVMSEEGIAFMEWCAIIRIRGSMLMKIGREIRI